MRCPRVLYRQLVNLPYGYNYAKWWGPLSPSVQVVLTSLQGRSCGSGGLACADGVCTSLDRGFSSLCTFVLTGTDRASVQCQSAGSTLGLVKACAAKNDRSCQVSCQDPRTPNQCVVLQTQLVDGSPCGAHSLISSDRIITEVTVVTGYGGTCLNGSCHNGSIWDTFQVRYLTVFRGRQSVDIPPC